ncbi:hypothetical protein NDU88_003927 [Pleurodeles waltl]|uniref:Uncharacterized protein n=1 Tax=Pleurodeles waltl TaxID=8319 RepID=A0AAV7T632_PLEWA|nr:hypothetical protein NDU88_003927 [Pleurodeles waltl]
MRATKARRGIPQRGEKNCVARNNFTSQDPVGGVRGRSPEHERLKRNVDPVGGVRGRSPERERLKRNAVSRNEGKRTVLPGGTSLPRILLVLCEAGAQNASA